MNPFPEPKTRQLLDEISAGYGAGGLSEFQVARLHREAKAMMVKLPAEAHMVLGALAGERHDIDEMHSHHTTSIALRQNEPDMRSNYAVSLARLGLLQEAIDVLRKVSTMEPENLAYLKQQLSEQIHGLRFTDALETKKTILQRQPDFDFDGFADVDSLGRVLPHYGYSQADAARHVDLAFALLRQHKVHFEQYAMLIDDDLEDSGIFVSLRVRADIEQTLVISDELFRILDDSIEDWNPAHLSVAIDPFVASE